MPVHRCLSDGSVFTVNSGFSQDSQNGKLGFSFFLFLIWEWSTRLCAFIIYVLFCGEEINVLFLLYGGITRLTSSRRFFSQTAALLVFDKEAVRTPLSRMITMIERLLFWCRLWVRNQRTSFFHYSFTYSFYWVFTISLKLCNFDDYNKLVSAHTVSRFFPHLAHLNYQQITDTSTTFAYLSLIIRVYASSSRVKIAIQWWRVGWDCEKGSSLFWFISFWSFACHELFVHSNLSHVFLPNLFCIFGFCRKGNTWEDYHRGEFHMIVVWDCLMLGGT